MRGGREAVISDMTARALTVSDPLSVPVAIKDTQREGRGDRAGLCLSACPVRGDTPPPPTPRRRP